ncbi:uncharacterized protein L969DRAFT_92641 [Mixia osmundae IAM 14324]|uniref:Zn(2)-C6 fungal-type domain-containing protein n=1 Tax=Mixia osmundae (strain CBS 9802 / IAM 14324 / JCM 22182 / KY 12970) TaxID=764103 RepID=G7DY49_MIXOS|nr:uncharacterized protein L969DRAFT_92641 [Mixia osmundae IAM 14324]KEI41411.1 hypothetical protein L969DRAFT_92641 [Mixia osmundae IAM 14324]GAA95509.1 hypothetical protein E5Q_02164 [Mixia osmundae IAM 14324]
MRTNREAAMLDKKRTRISLACLRCRQRKIRCDGAEICEHCRLAGVECEHVKVTREQNAEARARKERAKARKQISDSPNRPSLARASTTNNASAKIEATSGSALKRAKSFSPVRADHLQAQPVPNGLTLPHPRSPVVSSTTPHWAWYPTDASSYGHQLVHPPASLVPRDYHPPLHPQAQDLIHPTQPHLDALMRYGLAYSQDDAHLPLHPAQGLYPVLPNLSPAAFTHRTQSNSTSTSSSLQHHDESLLTSATTSPMEQAKSISASPAGYFHHPLEPLDAGDDIIGPAQAMMSTLGHEPIYTITNPYHRYVPPSPARQHASFLSCCGSREMRCNVRDCGTKLRNSMNSLYLA